MAHKYLFMVHIGNETFRCLGLALVESEESFLTELANTHQEQMVAGHWIFLAEKCGDIYKAEHRASHESWMLEDPQNKGNPYYVDVAEHDERVLFHRIVNGRDKLFMG